MMRFRSTGVLQVSMLAMLALLVIGAHASSESFAEDWTVVTDASSLPSFTPSPQHTFTLALRNRNLGQAKHLAERIADPASELFRVHLSRAELTALIAPSSVSVSALVGALRSMGASHTELLGHDDLLSVRMPTHAVERLFSVRLQPYRFQVCSGCIRFLRVLSFFGIVSGFVFRDFPNSFLSHSHVSNSPSLYVFFFSLSLSVCLSLLCFRLALSLLLLLSCMCVYVCVFSLSLS
jgi:Pro-kumamolisin, activation domain